MTDKMHVRVTNENGNKRIVVSTKPIDDSEVTWRTVDIEPTGNGFNARQDGGLTEDDLHPPVTPESPR